MEKDTIKKNEYNQSLIIIIVTFVVSFIILSLEDFRDCLMGTGGMCSIRRTMVLIFIAISFFYTILILILKESAKYKESKKIPIILISTYLIISIFLYIAPSMLVNSNNTFLYKIRVLITEHKWLNDNDFNKGNANVLYR